MSAGTSTPSGDALIGKTIGEFRLDGRIGAGATGVVYRATRLPNGGTAAVKVLNDHLGRISSLERRFRREARVLGRLDHPNIVHIFEYGVNEDATFIAMELLVGKTLDQRVRAGDLDCPHILDIANSVATALGHAHQHEVVHRDLKPANVFLCEDGGQVKLLDFGLAKFLAIDELSGDVTLTRKGRVVGTPAYMAPEQITGVSLDARADVYSFGVMLFEMITGRRPFEYAKRSELLRAHLFEPPPKAGSVRPDLRIDGSVESLLSRALAKDPDDRFQSADELRQALLGIRPDAVVAGDTNRRPSFERGENDTSSVVIFEDELREVRNSQRPPARVPLPVKREPLTAAPRTDSAASRPSSSSTDETQSPMVTWTVAVALAIATGLVSYWVGSMLG